jgi:hypothetical protein
VDFVASIHLSITYPRIRSIDNPISKFTGNTKFLGTTKFLDPVMKPLDLDKGTTYNGGIC